MGEKMTVSVRDNPAAKRFEADLGGGKFAVAEYNRMEGGIVLTHTEVPPEFEGRGIASQLYQAVIAAMRASGQKVIPVCPVFAIYIKRHPEAHDVLHPSYRSTLGIPAA